MHGVCFRAPGVVAWESLPDPRIESPTDAVVTVEMAGLTPTLTKLGMA